MVGWRWLVSGLHNKFFVKQLKIHQFIVALSIIFASSSLWAAGVPGPGFEKAMQERAKAALLARFNDKERAFFKQMTLEGAAIVREKIEESEPIYNCIVAFLKNPASCPMGKDHLANVKEAYHLYQNFYYMAHHDEVMRNFVLAPGGMQYIRLGTPFSSKSLRLDLKEIDHLKQLRREDEEFIANQPGDCKFTLQDKESFYNLQLGQIVTALPVVLFVNLPSPDFIFFGMGNKHETVQDADIVTAYEELLHNFDEVYEQFINYKEENLEGLIFYQMIANKVVAKNPTLWRPVLEGLNKRLIPQTFQDQFFYWAKNTFFTLNSLFIGCAVIATGSGMPFVAFACGVAIAVNQGGLFLKSIEEYNEYYRQWISGVRDWEAVASQKVKIQVEFVVLLFNVYALKAFVAGIPTDQMAKMSSWVASIRESTAEAAEKTVMDKFVFELAKEQGYDALRAQFLVPQVLGLGYKQILEMQNLERVSDVATEIIRQYKEKGYYTFKDRNEIMCQAKYAAQ
jgi:hypothetical protein